MRVATILLGAAVSLAGCYSPSLDACALACAANQACPDGLAGNAQGLCAASATDSCDPMSDGSVDTPENPRRMTVEVLDRGGSPQPGVTVLFSDVQGATVAEVVTDAQGLAQADMEPGGMATLVRVTGSAQRTHSGVTFLDLPPAAHIYVQLEKESGGSRTVNVVWTPLSGMHQYQVLTSCGSTDTVYPGGTAEATLTLPLLCTEVDVVVTARVTQAERPFVAIARAQSSTEILVDAWAPVDDLTARVLQPPTDQAIKTRVNWQLTPTLAGVSGLRAGSYGATTGVITGLITRDDVRAAIQLDLSPNDPQYADVTQSYVELLPAGAVSHDLDLAGRLVEHVIAPQYIPDMRRVRWSPMSPGVTPGAPDVVELSLMLTRDAVNFASWKIVAPTSAVRTDASASMRFIELPQISTTHAFQPELNDTLLNGAISLYGVPDVARRAFLARLGIRGTSIPGLDYISTTTRTFTPP